MNSNPQIIKKKLPSGGKTDRKRNKKLTKPPLPLIFLSKHINSHNHKSVLSYSGINYHPILLLRI